MWKGGGEETVSGAGSTLRYTESLRPQLSELIANLGVKTFLDAPCGDFNWMRHVELGDVQYIGFDIIDDVIRINKQRYSAPNRSFVTADVTRDPLPAADLLLCRDLLLHLPYQCIADLFENITSSDISYVLITSYVNSANRDLPKPGRSRFVNLLEDPFNFRSPAEHRRLPDWVPGSPERYLLLFERSDFTESARLCIPRLREARPTPRPATMKADAPSQGPVWQAGNRYAPAERPIDSDDLRGRLPPIVRTYEHISGLRSLLFETILVSLRTFGFFTKHAPRYLEYPWVIDSVLGAPAPGTVLDLGAGVSPVPLILAARGWTVTTIDYSHTRRSVKDPGSINEWGFLDYSEVDPRLRSTNEDFSRANFTADCFDVIYSISVIEHMPSTTRRAVFDEIGRCLKSGGRLVLTLDLVPGTHRLWNLDRGKAVETPETHGTLDDILTELRQAGLAIDPFEVRRGLPRSRTDIVLLRATKR